MYIHMKPIDSQKCHNSLSASAQSRSLSGSETQNIGGAKSKDLKNKKVFWSVLDPFKVLPLNGKYDSTVLG